MKQFKPFIIHFILIFLFINPIALAAYPQGDYFDVLPIFWDKIYPKGGETLYCGVKFGAYHGKKINIEHVFPMSWVTKTLHCGTRQQCRRKSARFNKIEADMHNFYPALAAYNQKRSAMSYAILAGEPKKTQCDFEINEKKWLIEPRPKVRGKIARAMLYMAHKYHLKLFKKQRKLLKSWDRKYPANKRERRRNQLIADIQGNLNQFIP